MESLELFRRMFEAGRSMFKICFDFLLRAVTINLNISLNCMLHIITCYDINIGRQI